MLKSILVKQIQDSPNRRIPFSTFMSFSLYHPTEGYYNQNRQRIGKNGDFYTSSSVGKIFGELWVDQFIYAWDQLGILMNDIPLILLEVGGGTGHFAFAVIERFMLQYPDYYRRLQYYLVEESKPHREQQNELLKPFQGHVYWFDQIKDISMQEKSNPTIIFSNELFDALPIDRVKKEAGHLYECWIEENDEVLQEIWVPLERIDLLHYIEEMSISLPNHFEIEIPLASKSLYLEMIEALNQGYIFTVDYGWRKEELIRPERRAGTLMGYSEHRHVTQFYEEPGLFDITSHVQFDSLRKWGEEQGLQTISYLTQREWMIKIGILNKLQEHQDSNPFSEVSKRNRSIVQFITPGGMGDTFKILMQRK